MAHCNPTLLLVEDDVQIRRFLRTSLACQGFRIVEAESAQQGLNRANACKPDLVVLDLGLPDQDGLQVIEKLRAWTALPIIVLSARHQEGQKIAALDLGADDYLTKPFGIGELLARIRAALRRAAALADTEAAAVFVSGELKIDLGKRQVFVAGAEVRLTPIEYRLLAALAKHAGKVLTQRQLLQEVWGPGHAEDSHYLRIYMGQLRRKLEADPGRPRHLLTEPGVGYRLGD